MGDTMGDAISGLNSLPEGKFEAEMHSCCASASYTSKMAKRRPFANEDALLAASRAVWDSLDESEKLKAFSAHPRIGGLRRDCSQGEGKFERWSRGEQSGMADADRAVKEEIAEMSGQYFRKHGFVFLICATGKNAAEMADALRERLGNDTEVEIGIAAREQVKITEIRLTKLVAEGVNM